jgi:ribose 1,5-bisphosphokinase
VTQTPTIAISVPAAAGRGRLVLVVGPSGSGKDTLIGLAQAACAGESGIVFPRRIVTREASLHEPNLSVSRAEFAEALTRGDFALHWEAHGLRYGLPHSIVGDLDAGRVVVANVSRTVIEAARRQYAEVNIDVTVVLVTAPPEVLAARLAVRNRASDGSLDGRLRRSVALSGAVPDAIIDNTGRAEDHARELVAIILGGRAGEAS